MNSTMTHHHRQGILPLLLILAIISVLGCSRFEDEILPEKDQAFKKYFGGSGTQIGVSVDTISTGYLILGSTTSYVPEGDDETHSQTMVIRTDFLGDEVVSVLIGEPGHEVEAVGMLLEDDFDETGKITVLANQTLGSNATIVMFEAFMPLSGNSDEPVVKILEADETTVRGFDNTIQGIKAVDLIEIDGERSILVTLNPGTTRSQVAVLRELPAGSAQKFVLYKIGFAEGEEANAFTKYNLFDGNKVFAILASTNEPTGQKMSLFLMSREGQSLANIVINEEFVARFDTDLAAIISEGDQTAADVQVISSRNTQATGGAGRIVEDLVIFGKDERSATGIAMRLSITSGRATEIIWTFQMAFGDQQINPVKIVEIRDGSLLLLANATSTGVDSNSDFLLDRITPSGNFISSVWPRTYGGVGDDFAADIIQVNQADNGYIIVGNVTLIGDNTLLNLIRTNAKGEIAN